jgi:hypothetical protein
MSNETRAELDRRAAEYWRGVAQADRSEARTATRAAESLSDAARREEAAPRRHRRAVQ